MKAAENTMTRIDRSKRALGTALNRDKPSQAAEVLVARGLVKGRVLDYGCGFGFDANQFGWESYDPYYQPREPEGQFDTIVCTLVLNALSRNNRARVKLAEFVNYLPLRATLTLPWLETSQKQARWGFTIACRTM
jgi:hypothetical protein